MARWILDPAQSRQRMGVALLIAVIVSLQVFDIVVRYDPLPIAIGGLVGLILAVSEFVLVRGYYFNKSSERPGVCLFALVLGAIIAGVIGGLLSYYLLSWLVPLLFEWALRNYR